MAANSPMAAGLFIDSPVFVRCGVCEGGGGIHLVAEANERFGAGFANGKVALDQKETWGWVRLVLCWWAGVVAMRSAKEWVHGIWRFVKMKLDHIPARSSSTSEPAHVSRAAQCFRRFAYGQLVTARAELAKGQYLLPVIGFQGAKIQPESRLPLWGVYPMPDRIHSRSRCAGPW